MDMHEKFLFCLKSGWKKKKSQVWEKFLCVQVF